MGMYARSPVESLAISRRWSRPTGPPMGFLQARFHGKPMRANTKRYLQPLAEPEAQDDSESANLGQV